MRRIHFTSVTCRVSQIKKNLHCTIQQFQSRVRLGEFRCKNAGAVLSLKLFREEITQSLRHRVPAGPEGETIHLNRKHTHRYTGYVMVQCRDESVSVCARVSVPVLVCWAPV